MICEGDQVAKIDIKLTALTARELARYWSKVDRHGDTECWLWTGWVNHWGYGCFDVGTAKKHQHFRAHRIAYLLGYGVDPGPSFVCHACDNPRCCNPKHLWLGDAAANMQDCLLYTSPSPR